MTAFILATLTLGSLLGAWLSSATVLSGKMALGLSLVPFAGFGLGMAFC
ncbi:MAG TPA: hypothetical protein VJU16_00395 [Planctomycetota bacterium]|nr:hypothetical protein [Planctomycetota bacterium]